MRQGIREEINRIILILVFATIAGLVSGYILQAWVFGVLFYAAWLLLKTRAFYLWAEEYDGSYPPDHGGIWGDIFDMIYRFRKRNDAIKEELKQQLEQVQASMNALQHGVVAIDNDDHIRWWNPAAEQLLGFKEPQDSGKPVHNLIRHPKFIDYLQSQSFSSTVVIPSPIDTNTILEIQTTIFGNQQKLLMVQDISRLVRLEQMRKDFVANVSHELRTPLTVINGYLEIIESNIQNLDETWRTPIKKINDQSTRMTEIVEDLSVLSRLDNDETQNDLENISVKPLIERICKDAREIRSDIDINISIEGETFVLSGSESELHSCFSNIIFNAVKYAEAQELNLSIRLEQNDGSQNIHFSDDGIGIDPVHLPRLTERFYRADKSHSRQTGGTGLGLAIVKHILMRHNGELAIESKLGQGSTFSCLFEKNKDS